MHPNQVSTGENRRLFISLQHRKPGTGLAFRPGRGLARRRPRAAPEGQHVKVSFEPDPARTDGIPLPPQIRVRARLEQARPLDETARMAHYGEQNQGTALKPGQARRLRKKGNHAAHATQRAKARTTAAEQRRRRREGHWVAQLMGRRDA
jgi:hypothetical protein